MFPLYLLLSAPARKSKFMDVNFCKHWERNFTTNKKIFLAEYLASLAHPLQDLDEKFMSELTIKVQTYAKFQKL